MSTVCVIPARGGSQRLPRKNIRELQGKPVISYSILLARSSGLFDQVIVSTDDDEISEIAQGFGANIFKRHADCGARGTNDVAGEVLRYMPDCHIACVLYPIAPLLLRSDLALGRAHVLDGGVYCMAVGSEPLRDAGAMYWGKARAFINGWNMVAPYTKMLPIPEERVCDVNVEEDWEQLERKFEALRGKANDS